MRRIDRIQQIQSWRRVRHWHLQRQPWHHRHWWQSYVWQQRRDQVYDHQHWWKAAAWRHRHWWNWRHWRDT